MFELESVLNLSRLPLDELLGLDRELEDPDEHAVFGVSNAAPLYLVDAKGAQIPLPVCEVVGIHRSDDQSQAPKGGMDLEFETEQGDLVVELGSFVEKRIVPLARGWETLVIALCNPDRVELDPWLRPLLTVVTGPVYWAFGDVQGSCEHLNGPRMLEAEQWFRVQR